MDGGFVTHSELVEAVATTRCERLHEPIGVAGANEFGEDLSIVVGLVK